MSAKQIRTKSIFSRQVLFALMMGTIIVVSACSNQTPSSVVRQTPPTQPTNAPVDTKATPSAFASSQYSSQDQEVLRNAIKNLDPSFCTQASTAETQQACKDNVAIALQTYQTSQEKVKKIDDLNDQSNQLIASGNYEQCRQLADETFARSCELNILVNKAIQENKPEWCSKASNQQIQTECQKTVQDNL